MKFHAPQLIFIMLTGISLGIEMAKHGEPKTGKYDTWTSAIAYAITLALLWWGGLF